MSLVLCFLLPGGGLRWVFRATDPPLYRVTILGVLVAWAGPGSLPKSPRPRMIRIVSGQHHSSLQDACCRWDLAPETLRHEVPVKSSASLYSQNPGRGVVLGLSEKRSQTRFAELGFAPVARFVREVFDWSAVCCSDRAASDGTQFAKTKTNKPCINNDLWTTCALRESDPRTLWCVIRCPFFLSSVFWGGTRKCFRLW
jgi:hypothetical protein